MAQEPESQLAELYAEGDRALLNFLRAELDIGLTLVRLSQTEKGLDEPASERARLHAERAVETIKRFRHRLKDDKHAREIEERLAELERLV